MRINYVKIKKEFPKSYKLFGIESNKPKKLYDFFDRNGVRLFIGYGAGGGYKPEIYRKKTKSEFKKENPGKSNDLNWRMIRISGMVSSYDTRNIAEENGFYMCFNELEKLLNGKYGK